MLRRYTTLGSVITKMSLVLVLLLASGNAVQAWQFTAFNTSTAMEEQEQNVSVAFKNVFLKDALHTLVRKANVGISYDTKTMPKKRVTYRANNAPIYKVLEAILTGTDLYATLSENQKVILIKKKPELQTVQQETITGTVTDASSGESLPGVNILVKGTSTGASTDANGEYELTVESLQGTLVVSYIGYQTKEVPINGRTELDIELESQTIAGEEMVVTGYREVEQEKLTSSISRVSSEQLENTPRENPIHSIQGNA